MHDMIEISGAEVLHKKYGVDGWMNTWNEQNRTDRNGQT